MRKNKDALEVIKKWQGCQQCQYGIRTMNRFVYSGPEKPKYLFVSDAPSDIDDITGAYSIVKLTDVLESIGVYDSDYGFTYCLCCTPWTSNKRDWTTNSIPETKVCGSHISELWTALKQPKVFSLGKTAFKVCSKVVPVVIPMPAIRDILTDPVSLARFKIDVELRKC